MEQQNLTDPVLGDAGTLFGAGKRPWGSFKRVFAPTNARVIVLADVVNGSVPQAQRDLFKEIEAWYPKGVHEVYQAILGKVREDPLATELTSLEEIQERLRLIKMNIRIPFARPAKCVLIYQFDPNAPDWFVVISEDYHVESCGLAD